MRVLANDDVYEATRHRMVAVEELHKKSWYSALVTIYLSSFFLFSQFKGPLRIIF